MSTPERPTARAAAAALPAPRPARRLAALRAVMLAGGLAALPPAALAQAAAGPRLGVPVTPQEAARHDRSIFPDGRGLPPGRGLAAQGAVLYERRCASCHGAGGRGATAEELVGGRAPLTSPSPDRSIGLYWPYATTLFDFIWRAMPMDAPGSLAPDEVYAITAWLLATEGLVAAGDEMNARTLPAVRMPNRDGFVGIDAPWPR